MLNFLFLHPIMWALQLITGITSMKSAAKHLGSYPPVIKQGNGRYTIYIYLLFIADYPMKSLISRWFSTAIFDETRGDGEGKHPGASLQFAAATASRQSKSKGQPWHAQPPKSDAVLYPDGDDSYTINY